MKKLLLFTGASVLSLAAFSEAPQPTVIEDALIHAISPNGKYAVSMGVGGMRIFDFETGEEFTKPSEYGYEMYDAGQTKCVSSNGIIVAISPEGEPVYWKAGEWYNLPVPENAYYSNLAQAITADGSRICGSIGVGGFSYNDDVLMQAPCVWNAEGDEYGMPVMLPHPDYDFAGRVPMYITAIDLTEDGKTVIGQVRDATGRLNYPIIYKEDENGEWTYEIPYPELINPDNVEIVDWPGDGPMMPQYESFMTPDEIEAYSKALDEYIQSGYQLPYPEYQDFMTAEEIEEYNKAADEYNALADVYNEKLDKYFAFLDQVSKSTPGYVFNGVRISPDGKTFGCTITVEGERDPMSWGPAPTENSVWLFDLATDKITKYEKDGKLNLYYIANDGIGVATTMAGTASNSFVLKNDETIDMVDWMNSKAPVYASWMKENMVFPYEDWVYNEETGEEEGIEMDILMSGRAATTPDLSVMALSVQNVWDYMDDGIAYIFNLKEATGVATVSPAYADETIYDLSGRKLKNASAPGIYIINGEKKVVR